MQAAEIPLCIDLDGTLIRTDILLESAFALLRQNFFYLFLLPFWLLKGKANLKQQIANRVDLDASLLPYDVSFLEYLKDEHASGRRLILATASNAKYATAVGAHLEIFDTVVASDEAINLAGGHKLERLREVVGDTNFAYAGNAKVDFPIWAEAAEAILVNPERGIREAAERLFTVSRVFESPTNSLKQMLKAMRLHQWAKNLLLFVPLALAHRIGELQLAIQAGLAFLAFGLCASSVYLLNDLLDLRADRQHPTKRMRPFASGNLSLISGLIMAPILAVLGFSVAIVLPIEFLAVLALYYAATFAYSFYLKKKALVDVLTLAGLYTIRLIAGAASVTVTPSFWLLAFSMFLFFSLALVKRYTELLTLFGQNQDGPGGRGYRFGDLETLAQFGISSAFVAVLVLAFYINSDAVSGLYNRPMVLWLLCPLLLYIIGRLWLLAKRDELHEDPVVFVMRDFRCQMQVGLGLIILWLAT